MGVRLHWRESGDPALPAVVWIHGGSVEDSSAMLPDLEPFLSRIRALLPDTRGHGLSQRFERAADYTYAEKCQNLTPGSPVARKPISEESRIEVDASELRVAGKREATVAGRVDSQPTG